MGCLFLNDYSSVMFSEFIFRSTTYGSDTAYTMMSFLKEVFFQDNGNLTLLQKRFIKKFLRIPLHFSLRFAVICHLRLAGAVAAAAAVKVQNTPLEGALPGLPALQGPGSIGDSFFSRMQRCLSTC